MTLKENSYYEGVINEENSAKEITLKLDASSKIKLTGDSYVTNLEDCDNTYSNIDFNGYKLYVNGIAFLMPNLRFPIIFFISTFAKK